MSGIIYLVVVPTKGEGKAMSKDGPQSSIKPNGAAADLVLAVKVLMSLNSSSSVEQIESAIEEGNRQFHKLQVAAKKNPELADQVRSLSRRIARTEELLEQKRRIK